MGPDEGFRELLRLCLVLNRFLEHVFHRVEEFLQLLLVKFVDVRAWTADIAS